MKRKIKRVWKKFYKNWTRQEMKILPGQIAFFLVLSMVPLVALIVAIAARFSLSITDTLNEFLESIPTAAANIIKDILSGDGLNFNMAVFYISAFLLASNGAHSMILASNAMYKFENKDYIRRRIKAVFMTIILVALILFVMVVPAFGDLIFKGIYELFGTNDVTEYIYGMYKILKYPVSLIFIFISIKLLYTMAPDTRIKSRTTTKGSIITTIGWILATEIYSYYVVHFTKYSLFYGSLANLIILFLWVYILAIIFALGMAFNETEYEELKREHTMEFVLTEEAIKEEEERREKEAKKIEEKQNKKKKSKAK